MADGKGGSDRPVVVLANQSSPRQETEKTNTRCERQGQIEIGIIEHEGRGFSAFSASVVGRNITGYTRGDRYGITPTTWCGKTMLDCRCEVVKRYWTGSLALMFRLSRGRFIIGYEVGESGMLFRGEYIDDCQLVPQFIDMFDPALSQPRNFEVGPLRKGF